ncbi:MAG: protein kinase, partial [Phycisphaerales bacterium JB043]
MSDLARTFEVFEELRSLPSGERLALLDEIRRSEPERACTLESMLGAHEDSTSHFLDRPVAHLSERQQETPTRIGAYQVVRELGSGTFGRVFLAQRDGPVPILAAIKVLHSFRRSSQAVRRFEREMRILTEVDDPGIGRLLDVGTADDGRPYFATQYIEGEPIDAYCRSRRLSPLKRAALVRDTCQIVHHAHQRGVIHRDLKPANILVTRQDERDRLSVIDFGIAKLLDPDEEELTIEAAIIGTPGYMSSEQRAGRPVDARSDVYSLGVILTRLLLADTEPSPTTAGDPGATIQDYRGPCRRALRWIVQKATREKAQERFPSAAHMAEELDRAVRGLPLVSRRNPAWQVGLLLARRRPVTTALAAGSAGLVTFLGARLLVTNAELEQQITGQSELIAETTSIVSGNLSVMAGTADARRPLVDDLLDRAAALKRSGVQNPSLDMAIAQLLGAQGDLALQDGEFDEAMRLHQRALEVVESIANFGQLSIDDQRWRAEALVKIGDVHANRREHEAAMEFYERAHALQEDLMAAMPADHIGLLDDICWSYDRQSIQINALHGPGPQYSALVQRRHQLAERLYQLSPHRTLSVYNLAKAEYNLRDLALRQGDEATARSHLARAVSLTAGLVKLEPGRTAFEDLYAVCLCQDVTFALRDGRTETAHQQAQRLLSRAELMLLLEPQRYSAQ